MSEQNVLSKAQETVDFIARLLCGFKIPATDSTLVFLESVLNHNGFNRVKVEYDRANKHVPVVTQACEGADTFGFVEVKQDEEGEFIQQILKVL